MSEQPDNLVLVCLRRLGDRVDASRDGMRAATTRLCILETHSASLSTRLNRIERGLDLADQTNL